MKPPAMTESQLLAAVIDLSKYRGLLVHHCRPARMQSGNWVTPIQGSKGFVDLVIAGVGGVIFRELKNNTLQPTPEQMTWLGTLAEGGADAALWRPQQWEDGTIRDTLARLAKPRGGTS